MDKINKLIRIKRKICKVQNVISIEDIYRSTNSAGSGGKIHEKLRLEALLTLILDMFLVCLLC